MIPWLTAGGAIGFPPLSEALQHPNGLLAAGGTLDKAWLVHAYQRGIFPWFSDDEPILWWSPDPRVVLQADRFHCSRSLHRFLAKAPYRITADCAFEAVVKACAEPRGEDAGTWITPQMVAAYVALHRAGIAHSIEVWSGDLLVGGIYGPALNGFFFGESMFSRATNGSKTALRAICDNRERLGIDFIDGQLPTPHLFTLGFHEMKRNDFVSRLENPRRATKHGSWRALLPSGQGD